MNIIDANIYTAKCKMGLSESQSIVLKEQTKYLGRITIFSQVDVIRSAINLFDSGASIDEIFSGKMDKCLNLSVCKGISVEQAAMIIGAKKGGDLYNTRTQLNHNSD